MKHIIIVLTVLSLTACGKAPEPGPNDKVGNPRNDTTNSVVSYGLDASLELPSGVHHDAYQIAYGTYAVPATLEVRGNASEPSDITLSLDYTECTYHHDAWVGVYSLVSCTSGAMAGDSVTVGTRLKLRVEYGPGMSQNTSVHADVEEQ